MENLETNLKCMLGDFVFTESESPVLMDKHFFGTKQVQKSEFRTPARALVINSGVRHFYVSSVMYKDNPNMESFRYMIIWTMAKIRHYRCKNFYNYELDKVFISGKTDEILIENLKAEIENGKI